MIPSYVTRYQIIQHDPAVLWSRTTECRSRQSAELHHTVRSRSPLSKPGRRSQMGNLIHVTQGLTLSRDKRSAWRTL